MNIETTYDQNTLISIGDRLRKAREQLGLSQQMIAESLCLKVSIICDIEEDKKLDSLSSIFLHGYIRSYAKLVQIPDVELSSIMQILTKETKTIPIRSFSLTRYYKKRNSWLTNFTWLISFTILGLMATWWWQNYKVHQKKLIGMTNQCPDKLKQFSNKTSISLNDEDVNNTKKTNISTSSIQSDKLTIPIKELQNQQIIRNIIEDKNRSAENLSLKVNSNTDTVTSVTTISNNNTQLQNNQKTTSLLTNNSNILEMKFIADCWIEVNDATSKKLFSGMQHKGDNLFLIGQIPYKLKISAPEAIKIQFQGKAIDLSNLIKTNQIAHLTLNTAE